MDMEDFEYGETADTLAQPPPNQQDFFSAHPQQEEDFMPEPNNEPQTVVIPLQTLQYQDDDDFGPTEEDEVTKRIR
jgi:hypothetical protein